MGELDRRAAASIVRVSITTSDACRAKWIVVRRAKFAAKFATIEFRRSQYCEIARQHDPAQRRRARPAS